MCFHNTQILYYFGCFFSFSSCFVTSPSSYCVYNRYYRCNFLYKQNQTSSFCVFFFSFLNQHSIKISSTVLALHMNAVCLSCCRQREEIFQQSHYFERCICFSALLSILNFWSSFAFKLLFHLIVFSISTHQEFICRLLLLFDQFWNRYSMFSMFHVLFQLN